LILKTTIVVCEINKLLFNECIFLMVGELYPVSSNSSVRLVSFQILAISACSWPSQHSCFFRKFHPLLAIVHHRPGSRHVVRPSVLMILVSSTRSSHTCDESKILTKHLPESFGPETNPFLSLVAFLAHEGVEGHMQPLASRALPTACFCA